MKQLLNLIDELGIHIYLDSFGIDPILISDLKEFKIREIKIDQKFISKLEDKNKSSLVNAMILLAKGLGIRTTGKGVEKKKQFDILKKMGCDKVQGFYIEKPMTKEALEEKYLMKEALEEKIEDEILRLEVVHRKDIYKKL